MIIIKDDRSGQGPLLLCLNGTASALPRDQQGDSAADDAVKPLIKMKLFVKSRLSKKAAAPARCAASAALALVLLASAVSRAQTPALDADESSVAGAPLTIKTTAELVKTTVANGKVRIELSPADRLVGGDEVIYTVEVRNRGAIGVDHYAFTSPIPAHMSYVANSAVAPGADISFSVDGGQTFDAPENLSVHGADGKQRPAVPADYTHIRWVLKNRLKAGSMTLARFRADVIS
jgi:uncharacterized repeat protein (TIGR01451 family)